MERTKQARSWQKWLKVGGLVLVLIVLAGIGANLYLNKWIHGHLKAFVKEGSKGVYQLNYQKVHVNVFSRSLFIENGELLTDTVLGRKLFSQGNGSSVLIEGKIPSLTVKRIHWMKFLFSGRLVAGELYFKNPDISLSKYEINQNDSSGKNIPGNDEAFANNLKGVEIKDLVMENASLAYSKVKAQDAKTTTYQFKKLNLDIEGLEFNSGSADSAEKLSFRNCNINFAEYEYRTTDSLYLVGLKDFKYSSRKRNIAIAHFYIQPRLSEKDYSTKFPHQKERNDISFENLRLDGVDLWALMNEGELNIQQAQIEGGHWNIYLSRVLPLPPSRKKVSPSQALLGIQMPVSIDSLKIKKFQLDYREYNTITRKTGEVKFNDVGGMATNITNEKEKIEKNPHLLIVLSARLMGRGDFKTKFDFMLDDTAGKFAVEARLGSMDATYLNPGFIPLNKVEVKKGRLDEMRCKGMGDQNSIRGNISLLYHDLHIAVLEDDKENGGLKRKTFTSVVANILVKNDNPRKDEPVRTANNIALKRDPRKSFFNLLWMALFTGIGQIVVDI
jgi:hypothetical protein